MYQFPGNLRSDYEMLPVPMIFYQVEDGKAAAVLLTDGFCDLCRNDRKTLTALLTRGLYSSVHPDDVGKVARVSEEFMAGRSGYDVIFRNRWPGSEYHFIHATGSWMTMPDGERLAVIIYADVSESIHLIRESGEYYNLFQQDLFYTDSVTGLPNVNYLAEFADAKVNEIRVHGKTPALIYLDVISMQSYNANYGLKEGDSLLALIAEVLGEEFPGAMIVRLIEDQFVVITDISDRTSLSETVRNVNSSVKARAFGNTAGIQAGICIFDENLQTADALSHAKNAFKQIGNNLSITHRFFSREADDRYWSERQIAENFDKALENKWIKVYYQCIIRTETGKVAALEALARWVDPVRGVVSPGEFIPALEKYNLMHKLDLYMMEEVCAEMRMRSEAGLPLIPVSVNFSAQDFDNMDIASTLQEVYARYAVEPDDDKKYLIVEITERDMANGDGTFHEQLKELRSNGFHIWLDDFGSGYSSLNVFSHFEIDLIKFDMDLLRGLDDHNGANRLIIKSMVDIARKLGIHTLTEGMETEGQKAFLLEAGCELAQGFLVHKPEPLQAILERLRSGRTAHPCETPKEREEMIEKWFAARQG